MCSPEIGLSWENIFYISTDRFTKSQITQLIRKPLAYKNPFALLQSKMKIYITDEDTSPTPAPGAVPAPSLWQLRNASLSLRAV